MSVMLHQLSVQIPKTYHLFVPKKNLSVSLSLFLFVSRFISVICTLYFISYIWSFFYIGYVSSLYCHLLDVKMYGVAQRRISPNTKVH